MSPDQKRAFCKWVNGKSSAIYGVHWSAWNKDVVDLVKYGKPLGSILYRYEPVHYCRGSVSKALQAYGIFVEAISVSEQEIDELTLSLCKSLGVKV